jgi:hypothetical protein
MQASFYKGTRPGLQGIYSRAVRWIDRGPYSHCELVFSDGLSGSASYIDGGVRFKAIDYSQHPEHWDFLDLPDAAEPYARDWFESRIGAPYDLMGNVRFVLPWVHDSEKGWFCSEAMAAALRLKEPWRFGPNGLAALLPRLFG